MTTQPLPESDAQSASSFRQLAAMVAILLLAVAGLNFHWKTNATQSQATHGDASAQPVPDTIVTQPLLDTFDESGQKVRQLHGEQVQIFEKDKRSDVHNPTVKFSHPNVDGTSTPWEIVANSATIYQSSNRVDLQGNVRLWSDATPGGRTEVLTEKLVVDTVRQYAETDKAVTIRARGSEASSTGLRADLANERLLLPSRVKEIHEVRH